MPIISDHPTGMDGYQNAFSADCFRQAAGDADTEIVPKFKTNLHWSIRSIDGGCIAYPLEHDDRVPVDQQNVHSSWVYEYCKVLENKLKMDHWRTSTTDPDKRAPLLENEIFKDLPKVLSPWVKPGALMLAEEFDTLKLRIPGFISRRTSAS